jgi:hypothetical protein
MQPIPEKTTRSHAGRQILTSVIVICIVILGYSELGLFRDLRLVNQAFPAIPSAFSTEMDMSIALSPVLLGYDAMRRGLSRWVKYPPATEPNSPLPTHDPISDQIQRARIEQGLFHPDDSMPLNGITDLRRPSVEALGRAIYLSQEKPAAAREFAQGNGTATPNQGFAQESRVDQLRQIFQLAYGPTALQEATQIAK